MTTTYILKYLGKKGQELFYCGRTTNIERRLIQHFENKNIIDYILFKGLHEKRIKFNGVKNIYNLCKLAEIKEACSEGFGEA